MKPRTVLFLLDVFGIGGSERVIAHFYDTLDRKRFKPIIGSLRTRGTLRNHQQTPAHYIPPDRLEAFLAKHDVAAVVLMGSIDDVLAARIQRHCKLLRIVNFTTTYGERFDANLITTKTDHLKLRLLHGKLVNDYVLYHPVDTTRWITLAHDETVRPFIEHTRKIVVGRIGRAEPSKWHYLILATLRDAKQRNAFTRLTFVYAGMPALYRAYIALHYRRELRDGSIVLLPELTNDQDVARFYKTIDVFQQACWIGESFGMVIAESLSFGKPVITEMKCFARHGRITQAHLYDAQIELVEEGVNGAYANTPEDTITFLLRTNHAALRVLGARGRRMIRERYDVAAVTRTLERILDACIAEKQANTTPNRKEIDAYKSEYFHKVERVERQRHTVTWPRRLSYSIRERVWRGVEYTYLAVRSVMRRLGRDPEQQ